MGVAVRVLRTDHDLAAVSSYFDENRRVADVHISLLARITVSVAAADLHAISVDPLQFLLLESFLQPLQVVHVDGFHSGIY